MKSKETIYAFIRQNKYMALATCSKEGKPEVATVEYVLDGSDLLINTSTRYRKYKNLAHNPYVACVITTEHDITLQFEGEMLQLKGSSVHDARQKMLESDPEFGSYFDDKNTRFFRLTPIWMRLRDYTKEPMEVVEYSVAVS